MELFTHLIGFAAFGGCLVILTVVTLGLAYIVVNSLIGSAVECLRAASVRKAAAPGAGS